MFFTGSDWCGWCKKIENEIFADPEFARAAGDRFVFVDLDFPINKPQSADLSQQNAQLKQRFGITGFPTIILLDSIKISSLKPAIVQVVESSTQIT